LLGVGPKAQKGGSALHAWPWDAPSTVVTADPNGRIGPPGHHGKSYLSSPNAIALSERAAAILQGFPDGVVFIGKSKSARWSQIGQAMPPPLAAAVARSIVRWFSIEKARRVA
jgi:site-specific DNA-cytosine methylase